MDQVLIIGGGLAGCTAALELANNGRNVVLIEKTASIGGKVRNYGCKATIRCNNCGLCLAVDLWEKVKNNKLINIITKSQISDIIGTKGNFRAVITAADNTTSEIGGISSIIVAAGFEAALSGTAHSLETAGKTGIIGALELEKLLSKRSITEIMPEKPKAIAFIQCFGSRDINEKAPYCSRVCCAYSTRAAKVIRLYYPEIKITFFYMDLQQIDNTGYFEELVKENMEFIRCRPVKIKEGPPPTIIYEKPGTGELISAEYDLIVLSEGVHPPADAEKLAEICNLGIDKNGFLKLVNDSKKTGIYVAGCASGPLKIEETYIESLRIAREILKT
jgi:heterodisulfide reductase subunit A2